MLRDYRDIIFGSDIAICMKCLNCLDELRMQQVIDRRVLNDQKLMKNAIGKLAWYVFGKA